MLSLIKQCSATVLCPARVTAMACLSVFFFSYWILWISLLWKNLLRVTRLTVDFWHALKIVCLAVVASSTLYYESSRFLLCTTAKCSLWFCWRVREEGKGWEVGWHQHFNSFAREGANCLLLMIWRHVIWLQHCPSPSEFSLDVRKIQAAGDSV